MFLEYIIMPDIGGVSPIGRFQSEFWSAEMERYVVLVLEGARGGRF